MEYLGRTDFVQVKPDGQQEEAIQKRLELKTDAPTTTSAASTKASAPSQRVDTELTTSQLRNEQLRGMMGDAPFCSNCGSITIRNGACYKCDNCGNSEGCS